MVDFIDSLVTAYETGSLTRRQLLQALTLMAAPVDGAYGLSAAVVEPG